MAMRKTAIIHFAFAPDHLDEQTSHGVFFLVVGWLQLLVAGALAFGGGRRPGCWARRVSASVSPPCGS